MKSREFLTVAQSLIQAKSEGAWRSAVSRAYYAAFHTARELLDDFGFIVPRGERAHGYLWLRLINCGDLQLRQAGSKLNSLRGDRNLADYEIYRACSQANSANAVKAAEQIILLLTAAATAAPTRDAIIDAMKVYERDILKEVTWKS